MNWKIFLTACISACAVSFPQNIIGCGGSENPYDYYSSFFSKNLPGSEAYRPFYYSGLTFLYDETEPASAEKILATEWAGYCGNDVSVKDAGEFVMDYAWNDINNLYYHLEKKQPLKIPDSIKQNSMTGWFIKQPDLEALGYILYAKKLQPHVTGGENIWEPVTRDTARMVRLIKNGKQLHTAAKKDIFKLKYAYQVLRLLHYSNRYREAVDWYDNAIAGNNTPSVLQEMSLALKAGALFRSGRQKEAAYLFSKCFNQTEAKRISNYLGFKWSVDSKEKRNTYLSLCKNDSEKAGMIALFAMSSPANEISAIRQVFSLQPSAEVLELLAVREINKLEEKYYTPLLNKQPGGSSFFYVWTEKKSDSALNAGREETQTLMHLLHQAAAAPQVKNKGLFETGAAYCALMLQDVKTARQYLGNAKEMNLSPKLKDQWQLTNLLLSVNESEKSDDEFEAKIFPSVNWLWQKAVASQPEPSDWYGRHSEWQLFYRNFMTEILAKRYHATGLLYKEALAAGSADSVINLNNTYYGVGTGLNFMHDKLESKDVEQLFYHLQNARSPFDKFLIAKNRIKTADVVDFAGTAYLRDRNYPQAIQWFAKAPKALNKINKDPFKELLYDREAALPGETAFFSKEDFAKEMFRLQNLTTADAAHAADYYYKMALGLYNTTYYGYAWEMVEYYRSGSDGYGIPANANNFRRNYYGCFDAHEYFQKAMNASTDKGFRAKCLFMMGKCIQKQNARPQYADFGYDYDKYDAASKKWIVEFKKNKYFPQLVTEYETTSFFDTAFSSCSYLRDFMIK